MKDFDCNVDNMLQMFLGNCAHDRSSQLQNEYTGEFFRMVISMSAIPTHVAKTPVVVWNDHIIEVRSRIYLCDNLWSRVDLYRCIAELFEDIKGAESLFLYSLCLIESLSPANSESSKGIKFSHVRVIDPDTFEYKVGDAYLKQAIKIRYGTYPYNNQEEKHDKK